ncbi:MAG: ATP-dependent zinc protease [Robiginitomaculum sp.]|nr:MAG: ATP-dependent zinc protease [Robiginitomaculum sp.]
MRKAAKNPKARMPIGWCEWAGFPDFGDFRIKGKIDTGAKTSALHAFRIREIVEDGEKFVTFFLHPEQRRKRPEIACKAKLIAMRDVKSSNGQVERRYVIRTRLQLGSLCRKVDVTLTNRDEMGFRLLVGRSSLKARFAVYPDQPFLLGGRLET